MTLTAVARPSVDLVAQHLLVNLRSRSRLEQQGVNVVFVIRKKALQEIDRHVQEVVVVSGRWLLTRPELQL